jgi:serine/threonine protein kinase
MKAKVIAGIALGMQSAHEHGIVHGSLKPNNILFDEDHCVQIVDFESSHFQSQRKDVNDMNDMDDMYEDGCAGRVENAKRSDVFSFASIMFDILVDRSSISHSLPLDEQENGRTNNGEFWMIPEFIPKFVEELIANGWSEDRYRQPSFDKIIKIMKDNYFLFMEGVDVWEVVEFVNTVEESSF